jgi:multidrug efflux pump subunit AcrA (membrane-fusion protein)
LITLVIFVLTSSLAVHATDADGGKHEPLNSPTGDIVTLSADAQKAIGLNVIEVKRLPLPREIAVFGTIEAMPTRTFIQHALLGGRVIDTKVELGDQVKKGQVLAILDSPEINRLAAETLNTKNNIETEIQKLRSDYASERKQNQARLDLAQSTYNRLITLHQEKIAALKSLETARTELEVAKNRLENIKKKEEVELQALELKLQISLRSLTDRLRQFGVPEESIKKMLVSKVAMLNVPVTSTRSGVITDVQANPGETINGESPLFDILDYTTVWAEAEVYEGDMDRVKANQKVTIRANAIPGVQFLGKVAHVGSEVDPTKRTLPVRVEIPNPNLRLKPDMFVELFIQTEEPTLTIKVPKDAVVEGSGHYAVFVQVKEGTYQMTRVVQGRSFGDDIEITQGLKPGQKVVARGAFQLDSNLLKAHGSTDSFTHPTEQHHHDEDEDDDDEKPTNNSPFANPLLLVMAAVAFVLGIGVASLFMRPSKQPERIAPQSEEAQEKSHMN